MIPFDRRAKLDGTRTIIERESAACLAALWHRRHAGTLSRQLGGYADAVPRRELDRLFAPQPDLTVVRRRVVARTMSRLSNQFLHQPHAALSAAATAEGTAALRSPDDLRRHVPLDRQPSNRPHSW